MNYILVDGGYFVHYRYYSMCTWWRLAKQEGESDEPFESERFRTKFGDTFARALRTLPTKLGLDGEESTICMATDCPKKEVWRNEHIESYKGNRKSVPSVRSAFQLITSDNLLQGEGVTIISAQRLEADDCIAITTEEIRTREPNATIWIITSDMDYLQLACEQVKLYDLKFKPLTENKRWHGDPAKDLFCKIVAGDKSDNIPSVFPRCGPKTAAKYYVDRTEFERKLSEVDGARERYERNTKLVDFRHIPHELTIELRKDIVSFMVGHEPEQEP